MHASSWLGQLNLFSDRPHHRRYPPAKPGGCCGSYQRENPLGPHCKARAISLCYAPNDQQQ
eukprot:scaffold78055_cov18-Tisochrysis_lutea.AAC.2